MANNDLVEDNEKSVTIEDFIVRQSIDAFVAAYAPSSETMATEVFSISRLRDFFQAWPNNSLGDPLKVYLEALESLGFDLKTSFSGQPAIFVTNREVTSVTL